MHLRTIGTLHNQITFRGLAGQSRLPAARFAGVGRMGDDSAADDVIGSTTGDYQDTYTGSADDSSVYGESGDSTSTGSLSSGFDTSTTTASSSGSGGGLTVDSAAVNAFGGIFSTLTNALGLPKPATTVIVNNTKTATPSTIMGVNTKYLLYGGVALLALVMLRRK